MTRRILVADDSKTIRTVVDYTFRTTEFEVFSASNAEEAMKWLEGEHADVILADVDMPQIDGYKLCDLIRTNAKTSQVPVLLLGGAFESVDETRAQAVGASGYVQKPFDTQTLIDRVTQLCGASEMDSLPASFGDTLAAQQDAADLPPAFGGQEPSAEPVPDLSQAVEVEMPEEAAEADHPGVTDSQGAMLGRMKLKRVATQLPPASPVIGAIDASSRAMVPEAEELDPLAPAITSDDLEEIPVEDVVFAEDSPVVDSDVPVEIEQEAAEELDSFDIDAPVEFAGEESASDLVEAQPQEAPAVDLSFDTPIEADDLLEDAEEFEVDQDISISDDVAVDVSDDLESVDIEEPGDFDETPEAIDFDSNDLEEIDVDDPVDEMAAASEETPEVPSFGAPVSEIMVAEDQASEEPSASAGIQAQWDEQEAELSAETTPEEEIDAIDFDDDDILEDDPLNSGGPILEPPPSPADLQASAASDVDVWSLAEPADDEFSDAPIPASDGDDWAPPSEPAPSTNVPTEIASAGFPPVADLSPSTEDAYDGTPIMPRRQALGRDPSAVLNATAVVADAVAMVTERGVESFAAEASDNVIADALSKDELIAIAKESIEKVAWEVVPELAESIIRSELSRLLEEQAKLVEEKEMLVLPRQHTPPPPPPVDDID